MNCTLGGDGVRTHQCQRLAFQFKAPILYSSLENFCAKLCRLMELVCLEEAVPFLSADQAASPAQEPLGNRIS